MLLRENVPLAPLTTLGVGGPARFFCEAGCEDDVREAVRFARSEMLPVFVMGGGSNLVFRDSGFHGLVLKIALEGITQDEGTGTFSAGAGLDWDAFVRQVTAACYAGIECLSGIPGTVGGTPVQNVGAYGQDVSQRIHSVRAYDTLSDETVDLANSDCEFGYRSSLFNTDERGRYVILGVTFRLTKHGEPHLSYPELRACFAQMDRKPTLLEVRDQVLRIRRNKGMVVDRDDPDTHSAGSFFKNPVLGIREFELLELKALSLGVQLPSYPAGPRARKVPAAWLVEHAGFAKGYALGNAGISSKHALAIVNRGGASSSEILTLMHDIQARVHAVFGIELHPEPVIVGF